MNRGILDRLLGNKRLLNVLGGIVVFALFAYAGYQVIQAGIAPWVGYWCLWPGCLLVVLAALITDFWREDRANEMPSYLQPIVKTYSIVAGAVIGTLAVYALMIVIVPIALVASAINPPDPKDP